MREILFRGQTRKRGQKVTVGGEKLPGIWVYGGIFPGAGDHSVIYGGDSEKLTISTLDKYVVYSETVGQFTGLTDKNGVKIFEGDICQVCLDPEICTAKIQYDERTASFNMRYNDYQCNTFLDMRLAENRVGDRVWIEVIGNIHDNPELLEG